MRFEEGTTRLSSLVDILQKSKDEHSVDERADVLNDTLLFLFREQKRTHLRKDEDGQAISPARFTEDSRIQTVSRVLRFTLGLEWIMLSRSA